MEINVIDDLPPETITYNYTSEGAETRLVHIPASQAGQSLALCGDTEAVKFYMWPADYRNNDVMACKACQNHQDLPLILLGGV